MSEKIRVSVEGQLVIMEERFLCGLQNPEAAAETRMSHSWRLPTDCSKTAVARNKT